MHVCMGACVMSVHVHVWRRRERWEEPKEEKERSIHRKGGITEREVWNVCSLHAEECKPQGKEEVTLRLLQHLVQIENKKYKGKRRRRRKAGVWISQFWCQVV